MVGRNDEVTRIGERFGDKTRLRRAGVETVREHDDGKRLIGIDVGRPNDGVDVAETDRLLPRGLGWCADRRQRAERDAFEATREAARSRHSRSRHRPHFATFGFIVTGTTAVWRLGAADHTRCVGFFPTFFAVVTLFLHGPFVQSGGIGRSRGSLQPRSRFTCATMVSIAWFRSGGTRIAETDCSHVNCRFAS